MSCDIVRKPYTPVITDQEGELKQNSIASLEQVELGGINQWILVRGHDINNPVLLFLHGGPGMPAMYLAHAFQRPLEKDFVIVHWDRRGAGKTFNESISPDDLSVSKLLSDTKQLTDLLRDRFDKEKIYLTGHSFGSYLGLLFADRHPELLHAFIGIGQVVDEKAALNIQERFIREEAKKRGENKAIAEIEEYGSGAHETWLFKFGGQLKHSESFWPFIWTGLRAPEYGLFEIPNVPKGSGFSSRNMTYDVINGEIRNHITKVEIPVYFFTGRRDYTTPHELIEQYYDILDAPKKEIVWFEESAHFPFFEEPEKFAQEMGRIIL